MTRRDAIVVSPHRFPGLGLEAALAERFALDLIVATDQTDFDVAVERARVILMTPYAQLTRAHLERASRCAAVIRYGVGYDNIDADAAATMGIPVANVPDASTEEVALHAVGMALSLLRRLPAADAAVRSASWAPSFMTGAPRLSEAVVGVVGLGRIGTRTADNFAAIGATVIASDPFAHAAAHRIVPVDELLRSANVISLHLPLTAESRHLISRDRLARMRRGAVLVNVSRGGLVDEEALADALAAGQLGGAALDVFEDEPLPATSRLLDAPNMLLSPHVAWRSDASLREYQEKAVAQAALVLEGRAMTSVVNGVSQNRSLS